MTTISFANVARRLLAIVALGALVLAMGGTWMTSHAAHASPPTSPAPPSSAVSSSSAARPALVAGTVPNRDLDEDHGSKKPGKKELAGKLNLNTASAEQLLMLPTVGPSKAERIIEWRKKNGGFKRIADLRRVKGFGYKTFKRLEPLLEIKGDTTLAAKH